MLVLLAAGLSSIDPGQTFLSVVRVIGGGFLVFLAIDALRENRRRQEIDAPDGGLHPAVRGVVAVLLNPGNPTNPLQLKDLQTISRGLHVTLVSLEVKAPDDIEPAFATMKKDRAGALIVFGDPMFGSHRTRIIDLAAKNRLPAIWSISDYVEIGGLMSYGTNFDDLYHRAATYVDKILKGTKPADLPVEQPTKFEFVVNLKTAKALNLTIPQSVLYQADKVIK